MHLFTRRREVATIVLALVATVSAAACGQTASQPSSGALPQPTANPHLGGQHSTGGPAGQPNTTIPFDQQFIDHMVPHHQGAVEMAKIAKERAEHAEIKQLADAIIKSQDAEIDQMKSWRKQWYGSDQTPSMDKMPMLPGVDHTMMGDMAADISSLRSAQPFDRAFIDAMIPHHQSAVVAAEQALLKAEHAEIKQLATTIKADQQREIDQMRQWRQAWYGSPGAGR